MQKAIKKYLDDFASKDAHFNLCYQNEEKNLKECIAYIMNKARAEIKGNAGYVNDDVVYAWAREYYTEEFISSDMLKSVSGTATGGSNKQKEEPKETVNIEARVKKQKAKDTGFIDVAEGQIDLFSMLD